MRAAVTVAMATGILLLAGGCLYPKELRQENQVPSGEYIALVQHAIDQFHQQTGVLPIKNSDMDTPVYEKYPIDFKRLQDRHLLGTIPPNAFEKGGTNLYVLVNAETAPKVKMLDLVSYQQTGDIQKLVDTYRSKHNGEIPSGAPVVDHLYWLDYAKLGTKPPAIKSPYSRNYLNLLVHDSGKVAIDYGPEIMRLLQNQGSPPVPDEDLRERLAAAYDFVPALSYPYYWVHNEPVIRP
ncbi:MAG: hypothetical protein K0R75_4024 [Paenibacillaceae bacterium]|nr:hypothetical protein [Paenibacillaceae bacterium]